ncbi:MAG: hypothetical protein WC659_07205 [Patescibacteria group bacterium]
MTERVMQSVMLICPSFETTCSQEQLQRQIAATDAQIDKLVYQLYGLTEEEIKVVENV